MKKTIRKPKGAAEQYGISVTVDKQLDAFSKKPLFSNQLDKVNALIASLQRAKQV